MVGWHILSPATGDGQPTLLIKHDIQQASYSVYITDLVHTWHESLDRKGVIKRALQDDTSIDPSEDASQLKILLAKIESSLKGQDGTSLQLTAKGDDLILHAHCILPSPLDGLQWRVELSWYS